MKGQVFKLVPLLFLFITDLPFPLRSMCPQPHALSSAVDGSQVEYPEYVVLREEFAACIEDLKGLPKYLKPSPREVRNTFSEEEKIRLRAQCSRLLEEGLAQTPNNLKIPHQIDQFCKISLMMSFIERVHKLCTIIIPRAERDFEVWMALSTPEEPVLFHARAIQRLKATTLISLLGYGDRERLKSGSRSKL